MILSEFERLKKDAKIGDKIGLTIRGIYGNYIREGILLKIANGRVYLTNGFSHHYKRIISSSIEQKELKP